MVLVIVWTLASWLHLKNAEHVHPLYYRRFIWTTLIYHLENVRIGPASGTRAINLRVNVFEYEQSDRFETEQLQAAAGKRDALRFLLEFRSPKCLPVNCGPHIIATNALHISFLLRAGKVPSADFSRETVCKVLVVKRPGGHLSL